MVEWTRSFTPSRRRSNGLRSENSAGHVGIHAFFTYAELGNLPA